MPMHRPRRRLHAIRQVLRSVGPYALATLPLAATVLYAKWRTLELVGFATAARIVRGSMDSFNVLEQFSLLRADLLAVLLAVPATVVILAAVTRSRWRPLVVSALLGVLMLAFYAQVRALAATGAYLHVSTLVSAVGFGIDRPDMLGHYLSVSGLAKTLGAIAVTTVIAMLLGRNLARTEGAVPAPLRRVLGLAGVGGGLMIALASVQTLPTNSLQRSLFLGALRAFVDADQAIDPKVESLGDADLVATYRALVGVPVSPVDSAYFGRARGHNLIRIVLETVPASCLDVTGSLDGFPSLKRLRERAFISAEHYAASPNSSLSNFAALSGWYPPLFARPYIAQHMNDRLPSIVWPLRRAGYQTALYEPFEARFELDRDMYRLFGIEHHVVGGGATLGVGPGWAQIARADSAALRALIADISEWTRAGRPFAAMFIPQISHAPWNDPVAGRNTPDLAERCRSLIAVQDRWIGDILRALEQHSQLERTVIVVTGDHGIRTAVEDPAFRTGALTEYTFRVPLILFAPQVLRTTRRITAVSSTVDLDPTLRDLFGIERPREREHGNTLWDDRLSFRTTFLLAGSYFGADGYYRDGRFDAWNSVTDVVCAAPKVLMCEPQHVLAAGDVEADSVRARIRRFKSVQFTWLDRFVERNTPLSRREVR